MTESQPKLRAAFVLDSQKKLIVSQSGSRRNYKIKLFLENLPPDTFAVTYRLHESYYNPIREVRDKTGGFEHTITSYGEFIVTSKIRTTSFSKELTKSLYQALKYTHGSENDSSIVQALEDIRTH